MEVASEPRVTAPSSRTGRPDYCHPTEEILAEPGAAPDEGGKVGGPGKATADHCRFCDSASIPGERTRTTPAYCARARDWLGPPTEHLVASGAAAWATCAESAAKAVRETDRSRRCGVRSTSGRFTGWWPVHWWTRKPPVRSYD